MKYNICILVLNSPNIPDYAHASAMINNLYAVKHNYDFIVERCPLREDLDKDYMWDGNEEYLFVWSKPSIIKKYLVNYDYIFFMDSDSIFVNHNIKIESIIEKYFFDDTCLLFGSNCVTKTFCYNKNVLNAGVFIVKNTDKTFKILNKWIEAPNTELCHEWKYKHPREQTCLNIIKNKYNYNEIKIIDYYILNGIDGNWIKHYMGINKEKRHRILNLYLKKNLIEYNIYDKTNVNNILNNNNIQEKQKLHCSNFRVAIIMPTTHKYINILINYLYTCKYNYDFIYLNKQNIFKYFEYYDYLLILDDDNIININFNIEDFKKNSNADVLIINKYNYLIKPYKNIDNIVIENIVNNIWFNKNINIDIINNLLLTNNLYNNDDINTVKTKINNINKEFYNSLNNNTKYEVNVNTEYEIINKEFCDSFNNTKLIIFFFICFIYFYL